jgi:hypothetical protein
MVAVSMDERKDFDNWTLKEGFFFVKVFLNHVPNSKKFTATFIQQEFQAMQK